MCDRATYSYLVRRDPRSPDKGMGWLDVDGEGRTVGPWVNSEQFDLRLLSPAGILINIMIGDIDFE